MLYASENALEFMSFSDAPRSPKRWGREGWHHSPLGRDEEGPKDLYKAAT